MFGSKPNSIILWVSLATATIFVLGFSLLAYVNYHVVDYPFGYDSSFYIAWMSSISRMGVVRFSQSVSYYHVLYPLMGEVIAGSGIGVLPTELLLPVALMLVTVASMMALAFAFDRGKFFVALTGVFSSTWFAIYRMGADFHAQLLAFPLLLLATVLFLNAGRQGFRIRPLLAFATLAVLAGLAHFEVTLFFVLVWSSTFALGSITGSMRPNRTRIVMLLISGLFTLVLLDIWVQTSYLPNLAIVHGPVNYQPYLPYWLETFGPFVALVIGGLIVAAASLKEESQAGNASLFVVCWSILCLAIGVLGYVTSGFPILYSDRALLLLPVPLLAALFLGWFINKGPTKSIFRSEIGIFLILVLIPTIGVPVVYTYTGPNYYRVFVSPQVVDQLLWLKENYSLGVAPIFVFNFPTPCAGDVATFEDNWVTYAIGQHYSYMGPVGDLLIGQETNYTQSKSQLVSGQFWAQLSEAGLANNTRLTSHTIVILSAFDQPDSDFNSSLRLLQVQEGAFVINSTWWANNRFQLGSFESEIPVSYAEIEPPASGYINLPVAYCD
jgi:hypothetical protein